MQRTKIEHEIMPSQEKYHPYTTQFDRTCTAVELLGDTPDYSKKLKFELTSQEQSELYKGLSDYKKAMEYIYGYVPPITLLLDNSGSMRGHRIFFIAKLFSFIVPACYEVGIPIEVLGFTTKTWKGGESREKWLRDGRPQNPGRLNDIQHTIFHAFGQNPTETQKGINLFLREGYLKENIDGEAIKWALQRLNQHAGGKKKHLVLISDGDPVDDSTMNTNNEKILEQHLKEVLNGTKKDIHLNFQKVAFKSEKESHEKNPLYSSVTHIHDEANPVNVVLESILPNMIKEDIEEYRKLQKQKVAKIVEEIHQATGEKIDDTTFTILGEFFDIEALEILRDFGYIQSHLFSQVTEFIHIKDTNVLKINLAILKSSQIPLGEAFIAYLQIAGEYNNHAHIQSILTTEKNLGDAIIGIKNSKAFFDLTHGQPWQSNFYQMYGKLILEGRVNLNILQLLMENNYIQDATLGSLYMILLHGNAKTLKVLIENDIFNLQEIALDRDIISHGDIRNLQKNISLLQKHKVSLLSTRFGILILQNAPYESVKIALKYDINTMLELHKVFPDMINLSIDEFEKKCLERKITKKFYAREAVKATFAGGYILTAHSLSGVVITNGLEKFVESLANVHSFLGWIALSFAASGIKNLYEIGKDILNKRKIVEEATTGSLRIGALLQEFQSIQNSILGASKTTILHIPKEKVTRMKQILREIQKKLENKNVLAGDIDIKKLKILYHITNVLYINALTDLLHTTNKDILQEAYKSILKITKKGPRYIIDTGYKYEFFLKRKSRIEKMLGIETQENTSKDTATIKKPSIKDDYELLGVSRGADRKEVKQAFDSLVKIHHPDRGGNEETFKQISAARDRIYEENGWV